VHERIDAAAGRAGRPAGTTRLLPVTKAVECELVEGLWQLGERDFAENRADGLEHKAGWFAERGYAVRWHFIGHLQTNKARRVARLADVIHSVDSARLVEALERQAAQAERRLAIYLQVNLTGEDAKYGMDREELLKAVELTRTAEHLELLGLMAMGPRVETEETTTESVFAQVAALARELEREATRSAFAGGRVELSLGMSGDLEQAIAAGSNVVRVGSALFVGTERSNAEEQA